jgi:hypothetical protein
MRPVVRPKSVGDQRLQTRSEDAAQLAFEFTDRSREGHELIVPTDYNVGE